MSLINCPECNHMISDKAQSCPNCGFPIADSTNQIVYYEIINICRDNDVPSLALIKTLCKMFHITVSEAAKIIDTPKSTILSGITLENAKYIESLFSPYCKTEISVCQTRKDNNYIVETYRAKFESPIRCPRCGSLAVTTGERGYSFLTGFLGSNKTTNRCAKCGHSWQPK